MNDTYKMKMSLKDILSLADEVEQKLFLPKKFRKAPFTEEMRTKYVSYLRREAGHLEKRIAALESGGPKKIKVSPRT